METTSWGAVLDFSYFSIALLLAFFLRSRLKFLQSLFIPSCIIAGVLVVLCGKHVFGFITLSGYLESYVYHLLTAVFAALALRGFRFNRSRNVAATTAVLCQGMAAQAILGVIFTMAWIVLLLPDFFPGFGLQLMLGYGHDYLVAHNLGLQWEQLGFTGGRWSGFSFGVMGFIYAYLLGIILVNWGLNRNLAAAYREESSITAAVRTGVPDKDAQKPEAGRMTTTVQSLESLTFHLAVIGAVMFVTFVCMNLLIRWLSQFNPLIAEIGNSVWMLNFLFAALLGATVRRLIEWLGVDYLLDRGLLARACGVLVDYAVVAAIAAIPLVILAAYWIEVVILSLLGAFATLFLVYWLFRKLQVDYRFERTVAAFGYITGNISSSLALLRTVDPEMKSPVAEDLAYAGGASFILGLPLLALLNLPLLGAAYGEPVRYLLLTLAGLAGYSGLIFLAWFGIRALRRRSAQGKSAA